MEDRQGSSGSKHQVLMVNRQFVEVMGVTGVESFDTREFVLQTPAGMLTVRGADLHIKSLNLENGFVSIEGSLDDLAYLDGRLEKRGKKIWGRLLK